MYSFVPLWVTPSFVSTLIVGFLFFFPFLVVISNTPFEALLPYNDVEDASFNTEVDSMSFGLILFKLPEYGTPSTTIRGELLALIDPKPLILIVGLEPGTALDWTILRPETRPSKLFAAFEEVEFSICSAAITLTEPVSEAFDCVPYATTTTSSSALCNCILTLTTLEYTFIIWSE